MSACPFRLCDTNVIMVVEQMQAGDDETTISRVPIHLLGGHESLGMCPASLISVPTDDLSELMLSQQGQTIQRMIEDQGPPPSNGGDIGQPPTGHLPIRIPPDEDRGPWFTTPRHPAGALGIIRPSLDIEKNDGVSPMATVLEVRASLSQAILLVGSAQDAIRVLSGQLAEALQLLNHVRETSGSPMGAPQVSAAIEKCDEIGALCHGAIEESTTYMGML